MKITGYFRCIFCY